MNGPTHRLAAGVTVGFYLANEETKQGVTTLKPVFGGGAAAFCTCLPDILEPATSPNHRQFFHSLAFAALVGAGMYRLSQWETETDGEKLLKAAVLLVGSAYLIHLALDFTTPKSLPLIGRL